MIEHWHKLGYISYSHAHILQKLTCFINSANSNGNANKNLWVGMTTFAFWGWVGEDLGVNLGLV